MSASRPRPGTGTSSTWSGLSCSSRSTSGAADPRPTDPSDARPARPAARSSLSLPPTPPAQPMRRYLFPVISGLLGVAIPVGLGVWQLQRAAWKEELPAGIQGGIDADP